MNRYLFSSNEPNRTAVTIAQTRIRTTGDIIKNRLKKEGTLHVLQMIDNCENRRIEFTSILSDNEITGDKIFDDAIRDYIKEIGYTNDSKGVF